MFRDEAATIFDPVTKQTGQPGTQGTVRPLPSLLLCLSRQVTQVGKEHWSKIARDTARQGSPCTQELDSPTAIWIPILPGNI